MQQDLAEYTHKSLATIMLYFYHRMQVLSIRLQTETILSARSVSSSTCTRLNKLTKPMNQTVIWLVNLPAASATMAPTTLPTIRPDTLDAIAWEALTQQTGNTLRSQCASLLYHFYCLATNNQDSLSRGYVTACRSRIRWVNMVIRVLILIYTTKISVHIHNYNMHGPILA
jgi:hypothetical protein